MDGVPEDAAQRPALASVGAVMSNPRQKAYNALREVEEKIRAIPDSLTLDTIEKIKDVFKATAAAQRTAVEWIDAIE